MEEKKDLIEEYYNELVEDMGYTEEEAKEEICDMVNKNYDSVEPSEYYDRKEVESLWKEGSGFLNEDELYTSAFNYAKNSSNDITLITETVFEYVINSVDIGKIAEEFIKENFIYEGIAKKKRKNIELKKLNETQEFDHVIEVKKVLNKAAGEGKKYVTACFDFGWITVDNVKISTDKDSYVWMQTGKATDEFTDIYVQPVSMNSYTASDYKNFMPYITRIEYGKKVLFEHEAVIGHELENKFHNMLYRYAKSGNTKLKIDIYELLDEPALNLSIKPVLNMLINNFYTELDMVKRIVEKSDGIFDEEIRNIINKYSLNCNRHCRMCRNLNEILEYLKEYCNYSENE